MLFKQKAEISGGKVNYSIYQCRQKAKLYQGVVFLRDQEKKKKKRYIFFFFPQWHEIKNFNPIKYCEQQSENRESHRGQRKYKKYKHIFKLLSCNVRDTDWKLGGTL